MERNQHDYLAPRKTGSSIAEALLLILLLGAIPGGVFYFISSCAVSKAGPPRDAAAKVLAVPWFGCRGLLLLGGSAGGDGHGGPPWGSASREDTALLTRPHMDSNQDGSSAAKSGKQMLAGYSVGFDADHDGYLDEHEDDEVENRSPLRKGPARLLRYKQRQTIEL